MGGGNWLAKEKTPVDSESLIWFIFNWRNLCTSALRLMLFADGDAALTDEPTTGRLPELIT
tara:strand:- start:319 stop:501 length:183 start_codon:yes stop_codon:yes gene_type:complete